MISWQLATVHSGSDPHFLLAAVALDSSALAYAVEEGSSGELRVELRTKRLRYTEDEKLKQLVLYSEV